MATVSMMGTGAAEAAMVAVGTITAGMAVGTEEEGKAGGAADSGISRLMSGRSGAETSRSPGTQRSCSSSDFSSWASQDHSLRCAAQAVLVATAVLVAARLQPVTAGLPCAEHGQPGCVLHHLPPLSQQRTACMQCCHHDTLIGGRASS